MLALVHPPADFRPQAAASASTSTPSRPSRHNTRRQPTSLSSSAPFSASLSALSVQPALASNSRSSSLESPSSSHRPATSHHPHPCPSPAKLINPKPPQPEPLREPVDIHSLPPQDLLRLLASLLTQIASANDSLSSHPPRADPSPPHSIDHSQSSVWKSLTTASKSSLINSSCCLPFHATNVPTISLESYLLRILKYCPTTNEAFLSLLVYFDRMAKLASQVNGKQFVIDSYNIHRLVIAGVTVASKFFSDVFYTNSRYAKVGGLPQSELNQLELQFLLLNDFRLTISPRELQRYAEQLLVFSETRASSSPLDASLSSVNPPIGLAAPMQTMRAVDAYGGAAASSPHSCGAGYPKNGFRTPQVRPRQTSSASFATVSSEADASDADTSEAGNETDLDGSTDDEPTIRPGHSSCSSDTLSMYSAASEDAEGDGRDENASEHGMRSP